MAGRDAFELKTPYDRALGYPIDTRVAHNLTFWRNAVLGQDMDFVAFVDGKEGSGKSMTLAPQLGCFMDVERRIDLRTQYHWDLELFEKAVMGLRRGKSVFLDEAGRYIDRRQAGSKATLRVRKLLWECRRRGLFLWFVMPSFYDADFTVAVHRTRILVHAKYHFNKAGADYENFIIPSEPLMRGFATFYTERGKKLLYVDDRSRATYTYPYVPNASFDFRYPEHYLFDRDEYRALRDEAEAAFFKGGGATCPECGGKALRVRKKDGVYVCSLQHSWSMNEEAES